MPWQFREEDVQPQRRWRRDPDLAHRNSRQGLDLRSARARCQARSPAWKRSAGRLAGEFAVAPQAADQTCPHLAWPDRRGHPERALRAQGETSPSPQQTDRWPRARLCSSSSFPRLPRLRNCLRTRRSTVAGHHRPAPEGHIPGPGALARWACARSQRPVVVVGTLAFVWGEGGWRHLPTLGQTAPPARLYLRRDHGARNAEAGIVKCSRSRTRLARRFSHADFNEPLRCKPRATPGNQK
jgi:hypothetical protein